MGARSDKAEEATKEGALLGIRTFYDAPRLSPLLPRDKKSKGLSRHHDRVGFQVHQRKA